MQELQRLNEDLKISVIYLKMDFKEISQKMKESKLVKAYIYLWLGAILLFGIGAFIYMNSKGSFSLGINILVSIAFIIILAVGFLFRARFLLLAGFIEGNKSTIIFQSVGVIFVLGMLVGFYKSIMEKYGLFLLSTVFIVGILIVIFNFLRLKELK